MRVGKPGTAHAGGSTKATRTATGSGGSFRVATAEAGSRPAAASGPRALAAIDALLVIQETSDATTGRRRAVKRGHDMLDMLEDLKISVLGGDLSQTKLTRLLRMVEEQREDVTDPHLSGVLEEIELRARVELAKYGRIAA